MKCGFGRADITPRPGITLSGFVARCNAPSEQVRDQLAVSVLYCEDQAESVLILSYDLLGIGPELLALLNAAIDSRWCARIPSTRRIFCATHNHSAPATIKLIGCGIVEPAYWQLIIDRTVDAVAQAIDHGVEVRFAYDSITAPGLNYNRRKVLDNGRVVMTRFPDRPVVKEGPAWNDFLFIRVETMQGQPIAGIVNWAAHACTVCSRDVTADYPGEFIRRLERRHGFPHMYLQGACGNVNLPFHDMTYGEMQRDVDAIEKVLTPPSWKPAGAGLRVAAAEVFLAYRAIPSRTQLEMLRDGMRTIASSGTGLQEHIAVLANILNIPPDGTPDPVMLRYIAGVLNEWSEGLLARHITQSPNGYPLKVAVVMFGSLPLVFVAAEIFTETALAIRARFPGRVIGIVGYASPLVGYVPPDDALGEGGYEVDHAYRFYGHPAVYAEGSEANLTAAISRLIGELSAG